MDQDDSEGFYSVQTHGNNVMKAILLSSNSGKENKLAPKIKQQLKVRAINKNRRQTSLTAKK